MIGVEKKDKINRERKRLWEFCIHNGDGTQVIFSFVLLFCNKPHIFWLCDFYTSIFVVLSSSVICFQLGFADAAALATVMCVIVKWLSSISLCRLISSLLDTKRDVTFWLRLHCSAHSSSTTLLVILAICSRKVTHRRRLFFSNASICTNPSRQSAYGFDDNLQPQLPCTV